MGFGDMGSFIAATTEQKGKVGGRDGIVFKTDENHDVEVNGISFKYTGADSYSLTIADSYKLTNGNTFSASMGFNHTAKFSNDCNLTAGATESLFIGLKLDICLAATSTFKFAAELNLTKAKTTDIVTAKERKATGVEHLFMTPSRKEKVAKDKEEAAEKQLKVAAQMSEDITNLKSKIKVLHEDVKTLKGKYTDLLFDMVNWTAKADKAINELKKYTIKSDNMEVKSTGPIKMEASGKATLKGNPAELLNGSKGVAVMSSCVGINGSSLKVM